MSESQIKFVEGFSTPSYDEWVAEVEKALKGAPFDKKMLNKTYEGITIRPVYTRQDWPSAGDPSGFPSAMPFTRGGTAAGNRANNWDVRQVQVEPDLNQCNEIILRDLERGVTSLSLRFDAAARAGLDGDDSQATELAGDDGIMLYSVDDLDAVLEGVFLDLVPIVVDAGAQFLPAAATLVALWERRGIADDKARGGFGADPLGVLAATGTLPVSTETAMSQLADLSAYTAGRYADVTAVGVDTSAYYNAGATETQDLAASMATAVAYLRAMTAAGLDVDKACRQILFTYSVGCDQFLTICKLRAARKMWSRVAEASGASEPARAMRLHAQSGVRMMSRCDPWVNMLRTTVGCFSAAVGGADTITVLPFDAALGVPGRLGRRVARNTSVILAEESNIAKVVDPAGGSWYVERRTDEIADAAWGLFQEIEAAGGMAAVLADGSFAAKIAESYAEREKNLARRKDPLTGISEFPNIFEQVPEKPALDRKEAVAQAKDRLKTTRNQAGSKATAFAQAVASALTAGVTKAAVGAAAGGVTLGEMAAALADDPTTIEALPKHRLAEQFEALRDAAARFTERSGKRPSVFLANLGPIAKHTARATFAKNFFEVGGIEALSNQGFDDAESCAKAFKDSGAKIAILCSADPIYQEMVVTVAPALKQAGCQRLYLAGHPGDQREAYTQAGVDDFIFMGGNVLETTRSALALLGVIDQ